MVFLSTVTFIFSYNFLHMTIKANKIFDVQFFTFCRHHQTVQTMNLNLRHSILGTCMTHHIEYCTVKGFSDFHHFCHLHVCADPALVLVDPRGVWVGGGGGRGIYIRQAARVAGQGRSHPPPHHLPGEWGILGGEGG